MKKLYEVPEIEVSKFSPCSDILGPSNEGNFGGEDNTFEGELTANRDGIRMFGSGVGFGW